MNTVTLYKNGKPYPYFSSTITTFKTVQATPRNQNLRSGYVDLQLNDGDLLNFNYLSYTKGTTVVYGWVMDLEKLGGSSLYRIHYDIDAFRTYKNTITLGVQWVERDMTETSVVDPLLSSLRFVNTMERYPGQFTDKGWRTLIVQVREEDREFPFTGMFTNTPMQPSPYTFYLHRYNVNEWVTSSSTLVQLLAHLSREAQTTNIVAIYSAPGDLTGGNAQNDILKIRFGTEDGFFSGILGTGAIDIPGFKKFTSSLLPLLKRTVQLPQIASPLELLRVGHNVRLVIPGAGIMNIPDELLMDPIYLTRYVDIFTGACTYSLEAGDPRVPYDGFLRESGAPSIPILSSVADTYLSQNQNALMTQIIGDTAVLAGTVAGAALTKGASLPLSMGAASGAAQRLISVQGNLKDADRRPPTNPPAMLGPALTPFYDGEFWLIVTRQEVDNAAEVHSKYGWPQNITKNILTIPTSGYLQTQACAIQSTNAIPVWAVEEINRLFDNGIFFT